MSFDSEKFEITEFKDRSEKIPVPDLKDFFGKKEDLVWEVRGLTAHELSIVNNAVAENEGREEMVQALLGNNKEEKIDALRQMLNIIKVSDNVPADLLRRHQTVLFGSMNPKCSEEIIVKLGVNFPTILFQLSQKIYELTGLGRLGEQKPCGKTKE